MNSSEEPEEELNTNQKIVLGSSFLLLLVALYFILWGNKPVRKILKGKGNKKEKEGELKGLIILIIFNLFYIQHYNRYIILIFIITHFNSLVNNIPNRLFN